jgi:hypothetical protein
MFPKRLPFLLVALGLPPRRVCSSRSMAFHVGCHVLQHLKKTTWRTDGVFPSALAVEVRLGSRVAELFDGFLESLDT